MFSILPILKGFLMKSTKHFLVMKRLLPGMLSLLVMGLLAACAATNQTTTVSVPKTSLQASHAFSFSQAEINKSSQGSYPDPNNQSALPASVKVTGAQETVLLRTAVVEGYQIYECQASTINASGFAWTLQAPFAVLKADQGTNVIHSTGPVWLYTQDGSEVRAAVGNFTTADGSVVPASATPDATAVPWLRLSVTEHLGKTGLFSNVDQVQRLYTKGGVAPTRGCNQAIANQHVILPVSYTAEYVFWGHKG